MNYQTMPGTLSPEQMRVKAMIEALRQPAQQMQAAPQQQGQVVSAHPDYGNSMDVIGQQLGTALGKGVQSIGTAMQYGTTPFSQQTNMLAAQDAAFR